MPTAPSTELSLRIAWNPALAGVRGCAVLMVLMFHFLHGDPNRGIRALHLKIAQTGWLGVDLFFVLSGYLITSILLSAKGTPHYFRNFYERRIRRIFPLYYAALVVMLLIVPLFARRTPELVTIQHDQWLFWLYLSNFLSHPIAVDWLQLGHFWSLAIEEQFYLLWPAVVFRFDRVRAAWIAFGAFVFSPLLRIALYLSAVRSPAIASTLQHGAFAWTPCRLDSLAIGSLIALLSADTGSRASLIRGARALGLLLAPILCYVTWRGWAHDALGTSHSALFTAWSISMYGVFACAFGCVIVECIRDRPTALTRFAGIAPLRFFGKYSYGIYVLQGLLEPWLRRAFAPAHLEPWFGRGDLAALAYFALSGVVIVMTSMLSWHLYETRFLTPASATMSHVGAN